MIHQINILNTSSDHADPELIPASDACTLLGISPATVSSYVRDIYRKLGISSRAEAAMEAARRGLVA